MPDQVKTFEAVHLARQGLYAFLGQVYILMPGEKLYAMIASVLPDLWAVAENSDEYELTESVNEIKRFFEDRDALSGEELAEFDLEALRKYTSLLCLASSVPAAESYYTSGNLMYMQESHTKMRSLLRKYSLSLSENVHEYDDHIFVELSFMAKLAEMSAEALIADKNEKYKSLIQEQIDMHANHFDRWIHLFAERVFTDQLSQGERLYNACTKFLVSYLKEDKILLQELHNDF